MKFLRVPMFLLCIFVLVGFYKNGTINSNSSNGSALPVKGEAAILIDLNSGEVLFSKQENKRLFPASTTKNVTALLALEYGNMEDQVRVGREVNFKISGESTAWLSEGQVLNLKELLEGLLLPSGNDAARTIAVYIARKEMNNQGVPEEVAIDYFVKMMNNKAQEIGATHTHFMNPNGLHNLKHYSTAYDLSLFAKKAIENPTFRQIVSQYRFEDPQVQYQNTNLLLNPNSSYYYEGITGIKTGFTEEAGSCLVSSATRNGKSLLSIVLKSTKKDIWSDSALLLNHGFHVGSEKSISNKVTNMGTCNHSCSSNKCTNQK